MMVRLISDVLMEPDARKRLRHTFALFDKQEKQKARPSALFNEQVDLNPALQAGLGKRQARWAEEFGRVRHVGQAKETSALLD